MWQAPLNSYTFHGAGESPITPCEFINIGTGKDLTIKELAEMIKNIIGFKGEIDWDTSKPDGLPREMRSIFLWGEVYRGLILFLRGTPQKLLDVSRISELGWKKQD